NFPAMPPHQPLQIQHAGTILVLVPRRTEPPVHLPGCLQPELGQPQQAQRQPLRLAGPLDRVLGPRPALLPTQPLLEVAEPVLLPEPRREQFDHLQARQLQGRSYFVVRDFGYQDLSTGLQELPDPFDDVSIWSG